MKKAFLAMAIVAIVATGFAQEDLTRSRNLSTVNPVDTWVLSTDGRWNKWKAVTNVLGAGTVMPAWDISAGTNINGANIQKRTVPGSAVTDATITNETVKIRSLSGTRITDATISNTTLNLSLRGISGDKITDATVSNATLNLSLRGISADKLTDATITNESVAVRSLSGRITDGTITNESLALRGINGDKLTDGTVSNATLNLSLRGISGDKITDGTVSNATLNLDLRGISGDKIADATITNESLADLAVSLSKLASAVTTNIYTGLVITPAIVNPGTNDVTVQVKNLGGGNPNTNVLLRIWLGNAANATPGTNLTTVQTITTGTIINTVVVGCHWIVLSDASGKAVVHLEEDDATYARTNWIMGAAGPIQAYAASVTSSNSP
jgi:hypothetical protein